EPAAQLREVVVDPRVDHGDGDALARDRGEVGSGLILLDEVRVGAPGQKSARFEGFTQRRLAALHHGKTWVVQPKGVRPSNLYRAWRFLFPPGSGWQGGEDAWFPPRQSRGRTGNCGPQKIALARRTRPHAARVIRITTRRQRSLACVRRIAAGEEIVRRPCIG